MERAKEIIRRTLSEAKVYLSQDSPRKISEADTKANFIEPIVAALGWEGIGVVTREYYVKDSQEFIDYVMSGPSGPLLAIEAKSLQAPLTDKNAAQLIQYCAVQGIEWAALTNGRELQFFNTFLKPDLSAKRILHLDLLAFNSDAEYDALFENLWQLSRESMTTSTGVRTWLNQRRLDQGLRDVLLDPASATVKHLRRVLAGADVKATPQEISQWFRSHLGTATATVPLPGETHSTSLPGAVQADIEPTNMKTQPSNAESDGVNHFENLLSSLKASTNVLWADTAWRETRHYWAASCNGKTFLAVKRRKGKILIGLSLPIQHETSRVRKNEGEFNWTRITKLIDVFDESDLNDGFFKLVGDARANAASSLPGQSHYGVQLRDLLAANIISSGATLVLTSGKRDVARATLSDQGAIVCDGTTYPSPSDKAFARMLSPTRTSLNGWTHWAVEGGTKRKTLAELRQEYLQAIE